MKLARLRVWGRGRGGFVLAMTALALGAAGLTALLALKERAEVIEVAFDKAALHARAFEDHLSQSFNVIDQTLANLAEHNHDGIDNALASKDFAAALRQAPYLRSLAVLDADGRIVASSNPRNLGRLVALADFQPPASAAAPALRVGPAWTGRDFADGQPSGSGPASNADAQGFVPVSRDVVLRNGRRLTLLAAVNSDFFINHYTQVLDAAGSAVEVLRYDGTLLLSTRAARVPGARSGVDGVTTRLAQKQFDRFEQRLENDTEVLTAYRASRAHPFVIVVHLDKASVLVPWREEEAGTQAVVFVVLLVAIGLSTWNYLRQERATRVRDAAEAALRASEAQYRNTFEHAAIGVAHASREGRVLRANQHLCDMLGYTQAELTQKTIDDLTHPDDLAADRLLRERLLSGELPQYQTEKRYLLKSGQPLWVRLSAGTVRDAAGGVAYRVAVIENIHLRMLTRLAMRALNTELSGEAFLRRVTQTLTTLLGVECSFIGVAAPALARRLDARAVWVDGALVADFSYALAGTPCERVTGTTLCVYADQVQQQFPGDALLATMGIESYAAVPLAGTSADGAPLGVLAIMSRRPLHDLDTVRTLLPLLALRVGAELLREREAQKFRDLFDGAPGAIFLIDAQGTIRMSSRAGPRLFGWAPQALSGQKLGLLFAEEHRGAYEALFRRFVEADRAGPPDQGSKDIWARRRDGSVFQAQVQLRSLETAEGRMTVAYVQDITERKRVEQELRERQFLLALAGRLAQLGGWTIDVVDQRLQWSDIVAELHDEPPGFSPSLDKGIDYFVPEHRSLVRAAVERCIADGTPYDLELEKTSAHGRRFWVRTMGQAERDAEGRIVRIQGAFQEITERKRNQDALRELNAGLEARVLERTAELNLAREAAEQANRAKSAFLATMSHEIRTPMNGVVGMIDVLEQGHLKGSQVEIVKTARESAYALLAIVDNVLDFSKIEAGQFQVDSEPFSVAAVVEGVCSALDPLAGQKGVELTLFTDPALPERVLGDAARLRQVLLNLAGNAIKFSSAEGRSGRVAVRARLSGGDWPQPVLEFSVTDNGIGMDPAKLPLLFTPFTQADASTTRRFGGTGLGLSISQGLVTLMGGTIAVSSQPGQGATFTVRLPLAPLPPQPAPGAEAFGLAGLHCLVLGSPPADDLVAYLAHSGALVQQRPDLASARRWLLECAPGLCIAVVGGSDDASGATPDALLAELQAAGHARPELQARFVIIERGARRQPRCKGADLVSIDRDCLRRSEFLKAVALAAGSATAHVPPPSSFDVDTAPAALSTQPASAHGRQILVAEDNEINRKVLRRQLALLGYSADIAGSGPEALACWQRGDYALLLTDLHMPEMDGYELTVAIRAAEAGQRRMPIVALTANAVKGEAKRCRELGMDDYMTKPVLLADLKAMLQQWLPAHVERAAQPPLPAPPTQAAAADGLALDVNVLAALVGHDAQVVAELLHDFRRSAGAAARELRAACQAQQAALVEAVAHRLKSSARSVGALALGALCEQMEVAGQSGELDALTALWPRFEAEAARVDAFLAASPA